MLCEAPCNKPILLCKRMRNKTEFFTIAVVMVVTSGCSYIESLFPDKERDYQYTAETPLLNWPSGLRQNKAEGSSNEVQSPASQVNNGETTSVPDSEAAPPAVSESHSENNSSDDTASPAATEVSNTEVTPAEESDVQDAVSSVEIIKYDDGESRLRLGAGFSKSWRLVNKALTRSTIEVTDRNHDQGTIRIQYDPDEQKAKDDSFMDEIDFIFKGININDKEYSLKFEEHGQQTDVIALDEDHLPLLNDNNALRLLKLLSDTIKADLVKKTK
jgi:outer membrane protein assembly factor BamC